MKRLMGAVVLTMLLCGAASAEEVRQIYNGMTVNANLEVADGKTLADGVILMTHGTLGHGRMEIMRDLQAVFKENGQSSLAITLSLGVDDRHGMYDCKTPHKHRHTGALGEIGAWIGWLKKQGAKKIVLLGHSRGGGQTARFATERDDPAVTGLILIAPMTWSQAGTEEKYEKRYGKPLNPILHKARAMIKKNEGEKMMEGVDFLYCKGATVSAETFVSYYDPDPRRDTPLLLKKIRKPVLVFSGSEDAVVPDLAAKMKKVAGMKNIRFVEIDGADHFFRDIFTYDIVETSMDFIGAR